MAWLPTLAKGTLNQSLAFLTQDVGTMIENRAILEALYCPTSPSCDTDPSLPIDITTIGAVIFVLCVGIAVGTDTTLDTLKMVLRHGKWPFVIGVVCQFCFMPIFAFLLTLIFEDSLRENARYSYESQVLGIMVVGALPGGSTSNLFTWFVGGNVSLSILMSLFSNICALGMMPLVLWLLYDNRFGDIEAKPEIPYLDMIQPLILTIIALAIGMLIRRYGTAENVWWVSKITSLFAIIFLFLAVVIGLSKYNLLVTGSGYGAWLIIILVQPVGYGVGWLLALASKCSLRNRMTIAFETGVQSFTLGMVLAQVSFNVEKEACQFSNECMSLIDGTDTKMYEYAWDKDGSMEQGDGLGEISRKGFLPGNAEGSTTGGCCRYNELVFEDVFRFSALCGLCYPLHALWMIIFFRKIFPRGRRPLSVDSRESLEFESVKRKRLIAPDSELEPCFAKSGFAGKENCPPTTIPEVFDMACKRCGRELALCVEPSSDNVTTGRPTIETTRSKPISYWTRWTWADYDRDVQLAARSLIHLGVERFGSVAIFGFNSPQWVISAMAAICCGAKAVGIYPTDTAEQVTYKTKHSGAAVAVIEDEKKLQRFAGKLAEMPKLKAFVMYMEHPGKAELPIFAWQAFLDLGQAPELAQRLEARRQQILPGHACCLVYTSGTTGMPKAVMLSHDNLLTGILSTLYMFRNSMGVEYDQERILSYLPLSHVAGFQFDITLPLVLTGKTQGFSTVYFARPYDLKEGTLKNRLTFVRPTLFFGVPRVFEKFEEAMREASKRTAALRGMRAMMPIICCIKKTSCIRWSKRQGLESMRELQVGGTGRTTPCYGLAEAAILSKVRSALGLDACKGILTGAAPISQETLEFFGSLGINILEVYGMSECAGVTTMSIEERHLWGSCGFEAPGYQVRAFQQEEGNTGQQRIECPPAQDIFRPTEKEQGELCFRGRHIMMGYMANQDLGPEHEADIKRKTEEAIDEEGWIHSGDRGCVDKNGLVRVTGRYKELIITAGGENVAPSPIEECIKQNCPAISNVMMVGDKRKYNVCIVTLKAKGATGELRGSEELAGPALELVPGITTTTAAKESPEYRKIIEDAIKAANKNSVVCPSNASQIQKFEILTHDFSGEGGELTTTLKLKRKFTEEKHADVIDSMYTKSQL